MKNNSFVLFKVELVLGSNVWILKNDLCKIKEKCEGMPCGSKHKQIIHYLFNILLSTENLKYLSVCGSQPRRNNYLKLPEELKNAVLGKKHFYLFLLSLSVISVHKNILKQNSILQYTRHKHVRPVTVMLDPAIIYISWAAYLVMQEHLMNAEIPAVLNITVSNFKLCLIIFFIFFDYLRITLNYQQMK